MPADKFLREQAKAILQNLPSADREVVETYIEAEKDRVDRTSEVRGRTFGAVFAVLAGLALVGGVVSTMHHYDTLPDCQAVEPTECPELKCDVCDVCPEPLPPLAPAWGTDGGTWTFQVCFSEDGKSSSVHCKNAEIRETPTPDIEDDHAHD